MSRINKLQKFLSDKGVDGALISSELNQRYFIEDGFEYTDGYILVTKEKAYLLADFRYIEAAREEVPANVFDIIKPKNGMMLELCALIKENGIKTLMFEDASVSCAQKANFDRNFCR